MPGPPSCLGVMVAFFALVWLVEKIGWWGIAAIVGVIVVIRLLLAWLERHV